MHPLRLTTFFSLLVIVQLLGCGDDPTTTQTPTCGDGSVEGAESCDDGNTVGGDGCSASCTKEFCGNGKVESATIFDNRTKAEETLPVDHVLVNIGFDSSLGPITHWGLEIEGGQIKVDSMMQTNRPGIFAAGDVAAFAGKLKLIATGFGEACIAVNFAKHYLDPKANIFPGHSSNMKR